MKIFTDGGARGNPGPAAIGFVVINEVTGKLVKTLGKQIGKATNNVAEYFAVIEALKFLKKIFVDQANFFLDSQLIVNQLNGYYKIKDSKLRNLMIEVRKLEQEVGGNISYHLIKREENQWADSLVNSSLA